MSGLKDKLHPGPEAHSWRVTLIMCLFLLLFSLLYLLLARVAPHLDGPNRLFFLLWVFCFLCYFVLCIIILMTGCPSQYWHWFQLSIIFVGAVVFRLLLLPLPLGLSRDAWRYLWDARAISNEISPWCRTLLCSGIPLIANRPCCPQRSLYAL